jgi:acyl-CoA thioesterase II
MSDAPSLREILTLDRVTENVFVGNGPAYPWGGLYGGQIIAQGLRAACATVDRAQSPHSLHAYFIRSGTMQREVRYEVELLREGRSFSTRRVVAKQNDDVMASMAVSFQVDESSPDISAIAMPARPHWTTLPTHAWSPLVTRHFIPLDETGRASAWMKIDEKLPDDPELHLAALAFLSDDLPTDAVGMLHPERVQPGSGRWPFFNASLDHTIHFHAKMRADEMHLHDFVATRFAGARGLSRGEIFDAAGRHVASVTQELLVRPRRRE